MVAGGEPDIVEVIVFAAGANAFLGAGRAFEVNFPFTGEDVFELVHAGVGEQYGRVIEWNDR